MAPNPAIQGRHFEEDISFGSSLTYATGGNTGTVTRGVSIERMVNAKFKAFGTSYIVASPKPGSESGQTFKYQLFQVTGGGTQGLQELPNGATVTTGLSTLTVEYEGT